MTLSTLLSKLGVKVPEKMCDDAGYVFGDKYVDGYNYSRNQFLSLEIPETCKHDWFWSNNAARYHCSKCNDWSYLGNHSNTQVATEACPSPEAPEPWVPSVEWISKILFELHNVTGEVYLGNITGTAELIYKALIGMEKNK